MLPLEQATIRPILDAILPHKRYLKDIIHIQIEKQGILQFGSYDNFHDECIVCFLGVPLELLVQLKASGVIRSWSVPHDRAIRWHG